MVTDEERDYMYRVYAADPAARLNLGIRRRLAPLLGNDRKKIELMNSLLFSLPGTPVIYYGDEIGMGDNFYLDDRNGVRTPMQWSPERNAGFSRANPQRLYLPSIIDPEYHYKAVNVENQHEQPGLPALVDETHHRPAQAQPAFGRGNIEFLQPGEPQSPGLPPPSPETRPYSSVANLSHLAQQTQLDLSEFKGYAPVDLFGRVEFAPVNRSAYCFTLSPYAFYWFSLEKPGVPDGLPRRAAREVPTLNETEESLFGKGELVRPGGGAAGLYQGTALVPW